MSELRRLFDLACELPASQRLAALRATNADAALIDEVLALLQADAAPQTRSREPLRAMIAQLSTTELNTGDVLGAWRLVREIGHGGMGAVYLAERADGHFQQQAAVKLIRGVVDADAAARFARERQLLANLQHPQIAHLLDGGATPGGHPYLVMEYVDGRPLNQWCAERRPGLDSRLEVFESICRTLQFAHQRLIVHCDLKPSNVLVRDDGTPVLLDFGVARALDRADVDTSTDDSRYYLTPRYASPEQARGEPLTIASDIYALGLLLYELVVDQPPSQEARAEEPDRIFSPSRDAPASLPWRKRLAGDIDAIVRRACAFDPTQRYASAQALAEDVERIGAHEPVQARPQTFAYVGARMLRRHWPVFAVGILIVTLAAGFTWRTILAEREARIQAATAERTTDFLVSVFAASDSNVNHNLNHELTARDVLDAGAARIDKELAGEPRIQANLFEALGNAYRHMDLGNTAAPLLRKAADINLRPDVNQPLAAARCLEALANTLANGEFPPKEAEQAARESLHLSEQLTSAGSQQIANAWMVLSLALNRNGNYAGAETAAQTTLQMNQRLPADENRLGPALNNLCIIAANRGDQAAAMRYCEEKLEYDHRQQDDDTAGNMMTVSRYAMAMEATGDFARSIATEQSALETARKIYGNESAFVAIFTLRLAHILNSAGRFAEVLPELNAALATQLKLNGKDSGEYTNVIVEFGNAYATIGDYAHALTYLRQAAEFRNGHFADDDPRVLQVESDLAAVLVNLRQSDEESRALLDAAIAGWRAKDDGGAANLPPCFVSLAQWYVQKSDFANATALLDQVEAADAKSDHWVRARAASLRADIAWRNRDVQTALKYDEQAWKILHDVIGAHHPQTARYGLIWARDLRRSGQIAKAETLEQDLQPVFDAAFPANSAFRSELATL